MDWDRESTGPIRMFQLNMRAGLGGDDPNQRAQGSQDFGTGDAWHPRHCEA